MAKWRNLEKYIGQKWDGMFLKFLHGENIIPYGIMKMAKGVSEGYSDMPISGKNYWQNDSMVTPGITKRATKRYRMVYTWRTVHRRYTLFVDVF